MSRTSISDDLIHRPEEVELNAQRFDQLCRSVEEIALPVVREALMRETAATGAEALMSEAKFALEGLVDDAAIEGLDEPAVLDEVRRGLECAIPPPDEEECQALARDVAQVLMSTWLEMLRTDLLSSPLLILSDHLLPLAVNRTVKQLILRLAGRARHPLSEAIGSLAINESEADGIMTTLRRKLFSKPCLVELPFELVIAGTPGEHPVFAMTRPTYEGLREKMMSMPDLSAKPDVGSPSRYRSPEYVTLTAEVTEASLTAALSPDDYAYLRQEVGVTAACLYRVTGRS